MQTTLYFCDRCGRQQDEQKHLWRIKVLAVDPDARHERSYDMFDKGMSPWKGTIQWCKPCVDASGLFKEASAPPPPTQYGWERDKPGSISDNARAVEQIISGIMNQNIRLDGPANTEI